MYLFFTIYGPFFIQFNIVLGSSKRMDHSVILIPQMSLCHALQFWQH